MKAIYKREVAASFHSMTGWLFIAVLMLFIGIYFMAYNLYQGAPYFSYALSGVLFLFTVLVPVLTMRSLAEERHTKTDQLLLTSPASVGAVILGKYFALLTVFAVPVALSCLCPLIIRLNGTAFLRADYATILIFFLLGALEIAVGLFISALTESQIIAAVGTFAILLLLYLCNGLVSYIPSTASASLVGLVLILLAVCLALNALSNSWKLSGGVGVVGAAALCVLYWSDSAKLENLLPNALKAFSPLGAFTAFANDHVFDLQGLLLYLSLTALMLFLCCQVLQKRRWN